MRIRKSQLKKLINEVIQEVGGTSGTRGGIAVPGSSNEYGPTIFKNDFPGKDYRYKSEKDSSSSQSLDSSWNQGYDQSAAQDLDNLQDDNLDISDSGLSKDDFSFIIDSQVTRGKTGQLEHVSSGRIASLQQGSSDALYDLKKLYNMGNYKTSRERSEEVCKVFMDSGYWVEEPITSQMLSTIGVKGMQTGKLYQIEDYFSQFQNGFFRQGGQLIERKSLKRRK